MDKSAASQAPGLIASLAGVAKNTFALVLSRLELACLELSEVRNHLMELIVVWTLALVAGVFALAYGSVLIVWLAWDAMGGRILLIMALVFALLGIALALYARALLRQDKLSFPATMAELKADRDTLL